MATDRAPRAPSPSATRSAACSCLGVTMKRSWTTRRTRSNAHSRSQNRIHRLQWSKRASLSTKSSAVPSGLVTSLIDILVVVIINPAGSTSRKLWSSYLAAKMRSCMAFIKPKPECCEKRTSTSNTDGNNIHNLIQKRRTSNGKTKTSKNHWYGTSRRSISMRTL